MSQENTNSLGRSAKEIGNQTTPRQVTGRTNVDNNPENATPSESKDLTGTQQLVELNKNHAARGRCSERNGADIVPKGNLDTIPVVLPRAVSDYLKALKLSGPASTYQSHKRTITEFLSWSEFDQIELHQIAHEIAAFIRAIAENESYNLDTVRGDVCTLSNFLGYLYRTDPELLSLRLLASLRNTPCSRTDELRQQVLGRFLTETGPSGACVSEIEDTLAYLRRSQYGTRIHAYVEILLETKTRPGPARALNLEDIDLTEETVRVRLPDTHLVGNVGLVENRVVNLSETSISAVQWYLAEERGCNPSSDSGPIFATTHGRVSSSTVRRALKQASTSSNEASLTGEETIFSRDSSASGGEPEITPLDVWWYAIRTLIQRE
jgi:site-specific recombinase XerD